MAEYIHNQNITGSKDRALFGEIMAISKQRLKNLREHDQRKFTPFYIFIQAEQKQK